jgi:hypothetical protein
MAHVLQSKSSKMDEKGSSAFARGRAPGALVLRRCSCGSSGGECTECRKSRERTTAKRTEPGVAPAVVHEVLRSPGQQLDVSVRSSMEAKMGHDFRNIRIHSGRLASQSAQAVNARAYTVGGHIAFNENEFAPESTEGAHLLAHELAHTIQNGSASFAEAAGPIEIGRKDDPLEQQARDMAGRTFQSEGGSRKSVIGVDSARSLRREPRTPDPQPDPEPIPSELPAPETRPKCGPDATDWFVRQVNSAMSDAAVLRIRGDMRMASFFAGALRTSTATLAEAGATSAVLAQETSLGSAAPARTADASAQISAGTSSISRASAAVARGATSFPFTLTPFPSPSAAAVLGAGAALASAAAGWRTLVNHAARYDFKAHPDSMNHPHSPHCPDEGCFPGEVGIVTICPGLHPENCYESDVPGNLFYALIGKFVGFSELTLQLGSQLAELTDLPRPGRPAVTWDSPEDTAAVSIGFGLPLPLTRTSLCGALSSGRSRMGSRVGCEDCLELTPSVIR